MSASINTPLGVIGGLLALGFVLATVASRLHADPVDQRSGCSDPTSQLQCYCRQSGVDGDLASATNFVAPCYLGGTQVSASRTFEMFSAWSWSALNWPVSKKNGVPKYKDDLRRVKGDNSTVWESWKTTREVFRADGRRPLPWSSRQQILPASCAKIDVRAAESNYSYAESIPDTLPPRVLTDYLNAEGDIVVDRNGELVRYETAMNKVAYDYIVNNGLYNTDEQAVFFEKSDAKIAFPAGQYSDTRGSYWVKAAWKVLRPNDRADEIHKAWAYLVPVFENGKMIANCSLKPVGLVGLHITY